MLLALAIDLGLAAVKPTPSFVWIHPIAPPMTHIPSMGEQTLGPPIAQARPGDGLRWALEWTLREQGTPEQRAAADALRQSPSAIHPLFARSLALRLAVQEDARAAVAVLGEDRVAAFVAEREALSARMGEQKVWRDAIERLAETR